MGSYRLILAALVVSSHIGHTLFGLNFGVVAVISFFILSGYVMTALIEKRYFSTSLVSAFYLDRLYRLQPQYLFYLILTAVYFFTVGIDDYLLRTIDVESMVMNIMIVPTNFYMLDFMKGRGVIPQGWSLGLEACFYLLIPFILIFKMRWVAVGLSILTFGLAYLAFLPTDWFGYRLIPGTLYIFLLGSFMYSPGKHGKTLVTAIFIASICFAILTIGFGFKRVPFNAEVLIGISIGIPAIYTLSNFRLGKFDELLGNISYGVFLNHFLLIWLFKTLDISLTHYGAFFSLLSLSIILAWVSFQFIEKPCLAVRRNLRKQAETRALVLS